MIYVFLQFLLLALIAWPIAQLHLSVMGMIMIITGGLIALAALTVNRFGNFNVRPEPKQSGQLVTTGIYHYVRHPMYSSLMVGALGILLCQFSITKLLAWVLLIIVLLLKAKFEERGLLLRYKSYQDYQFSSKMFIPLIW